ncbi:hypothetical protein BGZ72_006655 [Mortierella alpina]|nr:hypothetical protein BGZ72_006655 [Mortierella alpina]
MYCFSALLLPRLLRPHPPQPTLPNDPGAPNHIAQQPRDEEMMIMGHAKAQLLSIRDKDTAPHHAPPGDYSVKDLHAGAHSTPGTMQHQHLSASLLSGPKHHASVPDSEHDDAEDELNFYDYIHSKHDDDKDGDDTRSTMTSPMPSHATISRHLNRAPKTPATELHADKDKAMQSSSQDHVRTNEYTHHNPLDSSSQANNAVHLNHSDMDHLYESSSSHFPSHDQVPPPTQDLFRTLMEELQTQAAIQRDQFLASSTRAEPSGDTTDFSFNGHPSKSLPRFMMEPLDFLSANYESCLEPSQGSNSGVSTGNSEQHAYQGHFDPSIHDHHTNQFAHSSTNGSSSKKRPITDDSTITPPSMAVNSEHQSPPTQDLFRMLMEELETQAALQREQFLASTTKPEAAGALMDHTDDSLHGHHRLPRFVDFDFLSPDYGTMQLDEPSSNQSLRTDQDVFMSSAEPHESIRATADAMSDHHSAHSPLHSYHENLPAPTQDLFRTLMEELETQAAFQRDQALAATSSSAPKVDPEEYVFNGQHLRPLPRFMFEPLDFLSGSYDTCFHGDPQGEMASGSHFDATDSPFLTMDMPRSPGTVIAASGAQTSGRSGRKNPTSKSARRPSNGNTKYKTILPQRPEALATELENSQQYSNPKKKRKLVVKVDPTSPSGPAEPSALDTATSPLALGPTDGPESPVSPTGISELSISGGPTSTAVIAVKEGSLEPPTGAPKRPWTPKDEALLLKLFAKRTPIKEIAEALDRTVHSVRSRRQILTDPGFVKGKGHSVSRRCKRDPATTTKLPTYAQMAFLSLAWLPELEGTLNDVATMVEKLFSRHLNRIPRTGHKNLQIWRAQISDALAHEKGQPRPRFESFGVKRGRQWVYRLTDFGRGVVQAMGGVDQICEDLLKNNNDMSMAEEGLDGDVSAEGRQGNMDADGRSGGSGADAGIGQGQGYGYSYRTPEARQRTKKGSSRSKRKTVDGKGGSPTLGTGNARERELNAIANAMEAMAAGQAKMMALEDEKAGGV